MAEVVSKMNLIIIIGGLMTTLSSFSPLNEEKQVKKIASTFVKAADIQDPDLLSSTMYPDAMQFVLFGPKVLKSNASEYVAQIKDKKLGGNDRPVSFESVQITEDDTAMVKLKAVGGGLTFYYHLTMFKLEGEWKIMTITTKVLK